MIHSLRMLRVIGWMSVLLIGLIQPAIPAAAQELPPGYYPLDERSGVALYRKDYPNGTPDYVLTIDLSTGAAIDLLHGKPSENSGKRPSGMFAGTNPTFSQATITRYWELYTQAQPEAFCVTNGQFFFLPESPTPLALPLKVDGVLLAEGFGYPQYPEKQLMLALWADRADILPLTQENLYGTDAPNVLGGLTEEANKKPKNAVGRTFVGIADRDGDGAYETVAVLATQTATQAAAAEVLRSFGTAIIMMLDGGGSSQLVCQGQAYIDTTRAIPQALGIAAAPSGAQPASGADPAPHLPPTAAAGELLKASTATAVPSSPTSIPTSTAPAPEPLPTASPPDGAQAGPLASPINPTPTETPSVPPTRPAHGTDLLGGSFEREGRLGGSSVLERSAKGAGASGQVNMADALWLPAVIPPVSILILLVARRRSRAPLLAAFSSRKERQR